MFEICTHDQERYDLVTVGHFQTWCLRLTHALPDFTLRLCDLSVGSKIMKGCREKNEGSWLVSQLPFLDVACRPSMCAPSWRLSVLCRRLSTFLYPLPSEVCRSLTRLAWKAMYSEL